MDPKSVPKIESLKHVQNIQDQYNMINAMMNLEQQNTSFKFNQILSGLQSEEDAIVLDAVGQLAVELSLGDEVELQSLPIESIIPELMKCLEKVYIPDIVCTIFY